MIYSLNIAATLARCHYSTPRPTHSPQPEWGKPGHWAGDAGPYGPGKGKIHTDSDVAAAHHAVSSSLEAHTSMMAPGAVISCTSAPARPGPAIKARQAA